jgi:hypothetical protein
MLLRILPITWFFSPNINYKCDLEGFFCDSGVWTQGLSLARLALYYLNHSTFCFTFKRQSCSVRLICTVHTNKALLLKQLEIIYLLKGNSFDGSFLYEDGNFRVSNLGCIIAIMIFKVTYILGMGNHFILISLFHSCF